MLLGYKLEAPLTKDLLVEQRRYLKIVIAYFMTVTKRRLLCSYTNLIKLLPTCTG
jgi:hypothetical protein